MGSPLINKLIKQKNERKTQLILGGVLLLLLFLLACIVIAKDAHKTHLHTKQSKIHLEPFAQISEFNQSATGEAIGNLQTSQSSTSIRVAKLASENQALIKQNHIFLDQLKSLQTMLTHLKKHVTSSASKKSAIVKSRAFKQPHVVNTHNQMQTNMHALGNPQALDQNNVSSGAGIADFTFQYSHAITAQNTQNCKPLNCVLPGTFARAVLLGAADANASVNGQSNTTPILFKVLGQGILPNGYHVPLKGCFVVGEVYGDISSERAEVKLAQISCVMHHKTITKAINGTAYFLGKEGIRGRPVMRNGKLLWNAGVAGMLNGLASGVQQAATTRSISPLGQTSTIPANKIGMAMGAGGVQTAANTLANYYVKRADQYHPIIELNAGTIVNLVFLNKFLLTTKDQSSGAMVTKYQSNHYWRASDNHHDNTGKNNIDDYHYDDAVTHKHVNRIQQQINALGESQND